METGESWREIIEISLVKIFNFKLTRFTNEERILGQYKRPRLGLNV